MTRQLTKNMICNVIDELPDEVLIEDLYVEHSFMSDTATINLVFKTTASTEEGLLAFPNLAHEGFGGRMETFS